MASLKDQILATVSGTPGLTDREITNRIRGASAIQQPINQACRALENGGLISRKRNRPRDNLIGNYLSDRYAQHSFIHSEVVNEDSDVQQEMEKAREAARATNIIAQEERGYLNDMTSSDVEAAIREFDDSNEDEFYKRTNSKRAHKYFIYFNSKSYPRKAITKRAMQISEKRDDLVFSLTTGEHKKYLCLLGFKLQTKDSSDYISPEMKKERWALVQTRMGQGKFRKTIIEQYNGVCCITGNKVDKAIEAAHIEKWSNNNNNDAGNGLLMRADIHRLFDSGLISIEPETHIIQLHSSLRVDYKGLQHANLVYPIYLNQIGVHGLQERWKIRS